MVFWDGHNYTSQKQLFPKVFVSLVLFECFSVEENSSGKKIVKFLLLRLLNMWPKL